MTRRTDQEIARFFEGRDSSYNLFRLIRERIESFCSPQIEVTKTQISFGEEYKYIWLWLPQKWTGKRPKESITVTILTDKKIKSEKILESVQPKKGF